MTGKLLSRFLGREVNVYGTEYDDDGEPSPHILTGRLVAVEDGCLAFTIDEVPGEEVGQVLDARLVGSVVLLVKPARAEKPLQALDGGKVRRLKREELEPA